MNILNQNIFHSLINPVVNEDRTLLAISSAESGETSAASSLWIASSLVLTAAMLSAVSSVQTVRTHCNAKITHNMRSQTEEILPTSNKALMIQLAVTRNRIKSNKIKSKLNVRQVADCSWPN